MLSFLCGYYRRQGGSKEESIRTSSGCSGLIRDSRLSEHVSLRLNSSFQFEYLVMIGSGYFWVPLDSLTFELHMIYGKVYGLTVNLFIIYVMSQEKNVQIEIVFRKKLPGLCMVIHNRVNYL